MLGPRGAGDGAGQRQAAVAAAVAAQLVHERGKPLVQRRLAGVLELGGAGVRGADEHEAAGALRGGCLEQRLERVAAEQRVRREGVGAEAGHVAEGVGVRPTRAWAYAAAVTGTSPRLPSASTSRPWSRAIATTCSSASQPGAPSRSKQASCGLTATHAGPAATIAARQCSVTASAARARAR